jgi:hypothetical protein
MVTVSLRRRGDPTGKHSDGDVGMRLFVILIGLGFSLAPACANAAIVLDQQQLGDQGTSPFGDPPLSERAQTFTVGLSGTLVRIDVSLDSVVSGFGLTYSILETTNGIPNEVLLGSGLLSGPTTGFNSIDVSSFGIAVNSGDELAIALGTSANVRFAWDVTLLPSPQDPYAGGAPYERDPTSAATHN